MNKKSQIKTNQVNEKPKVEKISGLVTRVFTGDSFMIEIKNGNKTEQIKCQLKNVYSPIFKTADKKEELFAFEAMNFLRQKIIGKTVSFHCVKTSGTLFVVPTIGKDDIVKLMLSEGYAVIKDRKKADDALIRIEESAKFARKGMFSERVKPLEPKEVVNTKELNDKVCGFVRGIEAPGVIEVELLERGHFKIRLDGIYDGTKVENGKRVFDEIANEAMKFLQMMIFQKDVTVEITEKFDNFVIGNVTCGKKNVSEELLKNGFVKLNKKLSNMDYYEIYSNALNHAKECRLQRWKDYDPQIEIERKRKIEERKQFLIDREKNAEIITGTYVDSRDTCIMIDNGKEVVDAFIASVETVDFVKVHINVTRDIHMHEFIREMLTGKTIKAKKAFEINIENKNIHDSYYDIFVEDKNLAVELLKKKFVTLVRSRIEEERSFEYNKLFEVYEDVKTIKNPKWEDVTDTTNMKHASKAEQYLKKLKSFNGVVEEIYSPVSFKVFVPSENVKVKVSISGVKLPSTQQKKIKEVSEILEKASKEMYEMLYNKLCKFTFVKFNNKKEPTFICNVQFENKDLWRHVVARGYAFALLSNVDDDILDFANQSIENKVGIHKYIQDESIAIMETKRKQREEQNEKRKQEHLKRIMSEKKERKLEFSSEEKVHVVGFNDGTIYYYTEEDYPKYQEITEKLKTVEKSLFEEKEGTKVVLKVGKTFVRGEIIKAVPTKHVVRAIDTGMIYVAGKSRMTALPKSIEEIKSCVKSVKVFGIKFVKENELFYEQSLKFIQGLVIDKEFTMKVIKQQQQKQEEGQQQQQPTEEKKEDKAIFISEDENVFNQVLLNGYASVDFNIKKLKDENIEKMKQSELQAKKSNLNIWMYGELDDTK